MMTPPIKRLAIRSLAKAGGVSALAMALVQPAAAQDALKNLSRAA